MADGEESKESLHPTGANPADTEAAAAAGGEGGEEQAEQAQQGGGVDVY